MSLPMAIFHVRGFFDLVNVKNVGTEVAKCKSDVAALQETNIKLVCSEEINKCYLTFFSTEESSNRLTFIVNEKWENKIFKQCKVKGRIAILQLDSGTIKNKRK